MSKEDFSQIPDQTAQDELSRFVDEAITSYRQKAKAEEQYESPVPVFDEETGHYVYQTTSEEEEDTLCDEARKEQQLFQEANIAEEALPSQIPNPLPVPQRRDHVELGYDLEADDSVKDDTDPYDDFDIEIDDDDDFDI